MKRSWFEFFFKNAELAASKSKDQSTKVGAVIVDLESNAILSHVYNGFPRGVDDSKPERHERPTKYEYTEHAERNAIYNYVRQFLKGKAIVINYGNPCLCGDCARAIIQSGIEKVYIPKYRPFPGHKDGNWLQKYEISRSMLEEAEVEIIEMERQMKIEIRNTDEEDNHNW